ncbi:MAG: nicotinate phosphoribosyltransferase [bacterium]
MLNLNNFILRTDSYKLTHWKQYPEGTTKVYSYLESRGGEFEKTLFFGLQYYLKKYLKDVRITVDDINEAEKFSKAHFGTDANFNREGWEYIVKRLGGKLPIRIKAVKEGTVVPVSNVLATIENTDPNCYWLTNIVETLLLKLWYPITVATNSWYCKKMIKKYLKASGGVTDGLLFKLHDFGYRGVSSEEQAGIGGMSHLVNFMGTDTIRGIVFADNYYNSGICGYSVPASEHSVACSFGKENEEEYFLNMLKTYPTGIVSIVSDTYDVFNFVKTMSNKHKKEILNREGTCVFRPDSGDPVEVNSILIDLLWDIFGGKFVNGYKLLPPQIRLIQGDGIDRKMLKKIMKMLVAKQYSVDNIVFGSGGGLLQKFDRDTCKFAIKASYGERIINGKLEKFEIIKTPVTSKSKRSKGGMLKLHKSGKYFNTFSSTNDTNQMFNSYMDELETVYENGEILREQSFDEIRKLSEKYLDLESDK